MGLQGTSSLGLRMRPNRRRMGCAGEGVQTRPAFLLPPATRSASTGRGSGARDSCAGLLLRGQHANLAHGGGRRPRAALATHNLPVRFRARRRAWLILGKPDRRHMAFGSGGGVRMPPVLRRSTSSTEASPSWRTVPSTCG